MNINDNVKIAVVGLGYVGLPLAVEFGKKYITIGYDINNIRISELKKGNDSTLEIDNRELISSKNLTFTNKISNLKDCNVYIITVPTPVDKHNTPDLNPLLQATKDIASIIATGDIVIYESTVYPGATEEECVPIIEKVSGLKFNKEFFVGYSPERINPGDKKNTLINIKKVTSGSNDEASKFVDSLYKSIINAGTHLATSIKVAEAAKVIENTQRDINIALMNELSIIFNYMDIDSKEVIDAASTKWNFLNFKPGLVGGHCIGVDPYYLTHKALAIGYHPEVILAGRKINDEMGSYVAEQVIKIMMKKRIHVVDSKILVLGFSFKENCTDIRNTKVNDIVETLGKYNANIDIYDPWVNKNEIKSEYGHEIISNIPKSYYDSIIVAVGHDQFKHMGIEKIKEFGKKNSCFFDVKSIFNKNDVDGRL